MPGRRDGQHLSTWTGGRDVRPVGYIRVLNYRGKGAHVHEQIVIVERVLGHRLPPGAEVHHVNLVRADNRNENLVVLQSHTDHQELHRKMKVKKAGGNPWIERLCNACGQCKGFEQFYLIHNKRDGLVFSSYCKPCARIEASERQRSKKRAA